MRQTTPIAQKHRNSAAVGTRNDAGRSSAPGWLLNLQSSAGNRAVGQLLSHPLTVARQAEPAAESYVVTDEDKQEFKLLKGKIKKNDKKATAITTVKAYVEYRHDFFGSSEEYEVEKATADAEFDAMPKKTWNKIGQKESKAAKKVLYRWVRKAYVNAGIDDPVAVIAAGMTSALKTKLASVKAAHPDLKTGGFVARPQKLGGYKLGTISEHGTGKAVDVTPQNKNPHIPRREWKFLLDLAGVSMVNRKKARWATDPAALWRDIHDASDSYAAELAIRVDDLQRKRAAAGLDPDEPPAYKEVLKGNKTLIKTAGLYGIGHGVFSLDESLVTDFAAQGFLWGATFSDPDLHHFEIP